MNISELRRKSDRLRGDGQDRQGVMGTPDAGVMGHRDSSDALCEGSSLLINISLAHHEACGRLKT